jgi:addiction module RelE/StbE family toxin
VKRELLKSKAFLRSAKKFIKKSPQIIDDLEETLELLSEDAFYPSLKTHKLKGNLEGSWACSAGYDYRIVFEFIQHEEAEAILLEDIGTHDDVY